MTNLWCHGLDLFKRNEWVPLHGIYTSTHFFRCYMIFSMSENNIASDIPCFNHCVHKYLTILRIWADPCFQYKTSSSRFPTSGYFYLFDGNQALWRITGIKIIIKKIICSQLIHVLGDAKIFSFGTRNNW